MRRFLQRAYNSFREWLICAVVGNDAVMINCNVEYDDGFIIGPKNECTFFISAHNIFADDNKKESSAASGVE